MDRKGDLTLYDAEIHGFNSACCGFCVFSVSKRRRKKEHTEREDGPLSFLKIFWQVLTEQARPVKTCCTFRDKRRTLKGGVVNSSDPCNRGRAYWCQSALWLAWAMAVTKEEKLEGGRRTSGVTTLPEGGWGWMIVAGCFLATICIRAVTRWMISALNKCKNIENIIPLSGTTLNNEIASFGLQLNSSVVACCWAWLKPGTGSERSVASGFEVLCGIQFCHVAVPNKASRS